MEPIRYPLTAQLSFTSNLVRLGEISPDMANAFRSLREAADAYSKLDNKQRELCLVAGFAATGNEGGFRVHCTRAREAGATTDEIEQVVLLMLGTSLGLAPTVQTLVWLHEELD